MEILQSKKITLPDVYFIQDRKDIKDIPIGVPFIYGDSTTKDKVVKLLEYEVLYKAALKSGYPFNFKKILSEHGYDDILYLGYGESIFMEYSSEESFNGDHEIELVSIKDSRGMFEAFTKDCSAYVNMDKLKDLNVFPVWLEKIEDAVSTNVHNFAVFNPNMYNKKLDGMYGGVDMVSPGKNLIIIDISGSIPRAVSSTCLTLAKSLAETFYSDLIITGSISTLYNYEELHTLDVNSIYETNGENNDQVYFKELVSKDSREYKTAIVFGDNDSPCSSWGKKGERTISIKDGRELCNWKIDKLISFHTKGVKNTAAYADWFSPLETERIDDWVKYLR